MYTWEKFLKTFTKFGIDKRHGLGEIPRDLGYELKSSDSQKQIDIYNTESASLLNELKNMSPHERVMMRTPSQAAESLGSLDAQKGVIDVNGDFIVTGMTEFKTSGVQVADKLYSNINGSMFSKTRVVGDTYLYDGSKSIWDGVYVKNLDIGLTYVARVKMESPILLDTINGYFLTPYNLKKLGLRVSEGQLKSDILSEQIKLGKYDIGTKEVKTDWLANDTGELVRELLKDPTALYGAYVKQSKSMITANNVETQKKLVADAVSGKSQSNFIKLDKDGKLHGKIACMDLETNLLFEMLVNFVFIFAGLSIVLYLYNNYNNRFLRVGLFGIMFLTMFFTYGISFLLIIVLAYIIIFLIEIASPGSLTKETRCHGLIYLLIYLAFADYSFYILFIM